MNSDFLELLALDIRPLPNTTIQLSIVYRPPSADANAALALLHDHFVKFYFFDAKNVILGDLNIDLKSPNSSLGNDVLQLFAQFGLSQIVDSPTRVTIQY